MKVALLGVLASLFIYVGRWTPLRLLGEASQTTFLEIRMYIVLVAVLTVMLIAARNSYRIALAARPWGLYLSLIGAVSWCFFGLMMLSAAWGATQEALSKLLEYILVFIFLGVYWVALRSVHSEKIRCYFWYTSIFLGLTLMFLAFLTLMLHGTSSRLSVLGGGPNVFGRMMAIFVISCLWFWKNARGNKAGILALVGAVSGVFMVILSGSRGALLALLFGGITFLAVSRIQVKRVLLGFFVAMVVGAGILRYTGIGQSVIRMFDARITRLTLEQGHTSGRDQIFQHAVDLIFQKPIFGHGLGDYAAQGWGVYPHNWFLEIGIEAGLVAVIVFMSLLVLTIVLLYRMRRHLDGASVAAFVALFVAAQFSGDFYDNRGMFFFALLSLMPQKELPGGSGV